MSGGSSPSLNITVKDTTDTQTQYPVTDQPGQWKGIGSSVWKTDGPFGDFIGLLCGSDVVDPADYTAEESGTGTVIAFNESYLKTLPDDTYQFTVEFTDGYSVITLAVNNEGGGHDGG
jgi:hypothetical protein